MPSLRSRALPPLPLRPRAWWLLAPLLILALVSPMAFTDRSFDQDWLNHLWLSRMQRANITAEGHPSWFLHGSAPLGVFYPQYAFYGGTLYSSVALLSFVVGIVAAYVLFFAFALAMGLGGWTWMARQAGVHGALGLVPGVVNVTAAYVVANAYGRGAFPEFVATLTLPLVIAAAWALLRAPRVRTGPAAALVVGVVYLTGSHNITLVWGTVFLALVAVAAIVAVGPRRIAVLVGPRRIGAVAGLALLAVGVNAWFLLADLAYAARTGFEPYDNGAAFFNTAAVVLNPLRQVPGQSTSPGLTVQAPVLALAWALLALLVARARRRLGAVWLRLSAALALLLAGFLLLVLRDDPSIGAAGRELWSLLPRPLHYVQFAFRVQSYVTLLICALVLVAVVAVARAPRGGRRTALLVAAAALGLGSSYQAVHQAWWQPSFRLLPERGEVVHGPVRQVPVSWSDGGSFRDRSARELSIPDRRRLEVPPALAARGGGVVPAPPGRAPIQTNIGGGPYLVHVGGTVASAGRIQSGEMAVARPAGGSGPVEVRLQPASTWPLNDGPPITLVSLVVLTALAARAPMRRLLGRRGARRRRADAARPASPRTARR